MTSKTPDPQQDKTLLEFTGTINGDDVIMTLSYKNGRGLSALQFAHQINERFPQLLKNMYDDGDQSVVDMLNTKGIEFADPDDGEYDDDEEL